MSRLLTPKPLTQEAFAPFGDVIEANLSRNHFTINQGHTERFHDLAQLDMGEGKTILSLFRSRPMTLTEDRHLAIKLLERHPLGTQAFVPTGSHPYLVVVAPKGDLDEEAIEVFLAQSNQGVNYHQGTWHHFCLALNDVSYFLVADRDGPGHNCDELELTTPCFIDLSLLDL